MKKFIYVIMFAAICVTACKKDKAPVQNVKGKQSINIKVGFSQTVEPYNAGKIATNALNTTAADTALTNHVSQLFYIIYDANGQIVQNNQQSSSSDKFGTYTNSIDPGTYTLVVAASNDFVDFKGTDLPSSIFRGILPGRPTTLPIQEFYFKKMPITVGDAPLNLNVIVDRVSSLLRIKLTDAVIPQNVALITLIVDDLARVFQVSTQSGLTGGTAYIGGNEYPVSDRTNFSASFPFLANRSYFRTVTLTATDANRNIISKVNLTNVPIAPNAITTLKGSMFSTNPSGAGLAVSVDTTWTNVYKPF